MSTAAIDAMCIMNEPPPPQRAIRQRHQRRRRRTRSRAEASCRSYSAAGAAASSGTSAGFTGGGGNTCNQGGGKTIEVTDDGVIGGRRPASAAGSPLPPLQLPLPLLIILMLALCPSPADATLYLHSTSSDGYAIQTPYSSEPARFGRVFDGTITGPANLFLPPWGVDSRLCGIDGISSRAEEGGAVGGEDIMSVGGEGGDGDGVRRLDDIVPLGRPSSSRDNLPHGHGTHHRRRPHTSNHRRRLLDLLDDDDATTDLDVNFGMGMDMDYITETEAEMNGQYEEGEEDAQASLLHLRHRYLMASSSGDNGKDGAGYSAIGNSDQHQKQDHAKLKTTRRTAPKRRAANDKQRAASDKHSHRDLHEQYGTNSRGGGNSHYNPSSGGDAPHSSPYSSSSRSSSLSGLDQPRPIALLVERGGCTFHEKAVNAMRLNRRLLREAVLLSRDGQERTDNDGSDGDNGDEDDGANRKRVYEFPDKGDADMDGDGDGRRRGERRLNAHRTLQGDGADDAADAATNTFDQDTIIEQGLDSVQRDMDKSEVGTARPSDLIGDGGVPLGGYGNNGSGSDNGSSNIFVELPTLRIDYLVVYNDEANSAYGKEDDLVLMDRPSNAQDIDRVDVGLVFISRRSGLDLRRRMDELSSTEYGTTVPWPSGLTTDYNDGSEGDDEDNIPAYYITPRDLFPSTATEKGGWSLPISVDQKKELGPYSVTGWPRGSTPRDSFYWIRFVLIALLIVTPVMRGCFVWHGAGGRVQFRRNDAGRIVGLHIVRPSGSWITGWDDGPWEEGGAERRRDRIRKMTQDEVMNLPEIEYTASPDDGDEDDKDEDGEDLEGRDDTGKQDGIEDAADVNVVSSASQESRESETSATGDLSANSPAPKTTCTSCSICIDDFETGEKIRLLPRCGHAFHTDCILPWLTERSGSCPLCKRNVMDDGTDGLEESSSDENDANSIIGDEGDLEERAIENEDTDIEEGQASSRHRAQDSRPTRDSVSSSSSNSAGTRRARRRRRNGLDAGT